MAPISDAIYQRKKRPPLLNKHTQNYLHAFFFLSIGYLNVGEFQ